MAGSDRTNSRSNQLETSDRPERNAIVDVPPKPAQASKAEMTGSKSSSAGNHQRNGAARKLLPVVILLGIIAIVGYFAWNFFVSQSERGKLRVSGRIEGYETNIGAKIGGRVNFIAVREGDLVKTGELVVRLSDDDIQAQLRGAKARLKKAIEARDQATEQIVIANTAVTQAQLNKEQAIEDADGRIVQAEAQVASSRANLSQAEAQLTQSEADLKLAELRKVRYDTLASQGAVMQDQADQADTTLATARATTNSRKAAVDAARKQLLAAEGNLTQAKTTRLNPNIRTAGLLAAERQLAQAQLQLRAADHEIQNSKAAVDEINANIAYLNIPSPIDATVTARAVEPGAVVVAGQTVLSVINLETVYLRAYFPEGDIGKVRVGQQAFVYLDSAPKKGIPAKVIEVDPEASFTPENIYFKDDRVKQVFGIKIGIKDPHGFPKPGMPADADIILDSN
jgi:HlyD family secretion protein